MNAEAATTPRRLCVRCALWLDSQSCIAGRFAYWRLQLIDKLYVMGVVIIDLDIAPFHDFMAFSTDRTLLGCLNIARKVRR